MKMKDLLDSIEPEKKLKKKKKAKKEAVKKKKSTKTHDKKKSSEESSKPKAAKQAPTASIVEQTEPSPITVAQPSPPQPVKPTKPAALTPPSANTRPTTPSPSGLQVSTEVIRNRVSKNLQVPPVTEQKSAIEKITQQLMLGDISQGVALRELRVKVLGVRQENFANQVGVSRKTLSEIENNKGNYTSEIINRVFKPFGLQVGLMPSARQDRLALFKK